MDNQPIIFGIGGLVVGAFVGVALGGSMATDKINAAVSGALESTEDGAGEAAAATQEAIAALGDRIAALESDLSESNAATSEVSEQVRVQLGQMQESLTASIDSVADTTADGNAELRAALEEVTASMGGASRASEGPTAEAETAAAEPDSETAAPADPDVAAAPAAGLSAGVGETVAFADGAVRAFVSQLVSGDGTARISVNGDLATLAVGDAVIARVDETECAVTLTGVDNASATLCSDCDGDAAEGAATADVPAAP